MPQSRNSDFEIVRQKQKPSGLPQLLNLGANNLEFALQLNLFLL
jgi:hypothetical protein